MRINYLKIICLIVFVGFYVQANSQEGYFQLRGSIISQNKEKLGSFKYKVYEDNKVTVKPRTSVNGSFTIKFKLNNTYLVEFLKEGFNSKRIIVDTKVPDKKKSASYDHFRLIKLDSTGQGDTRSIAGLPVIKFYYKVEINGFTYEKITGEQVTYQTTSSQMIKMLEKRLHAIVAVMNRQPAQVEKYMVLILVRYADAVSLDLH